MTRSVGRLFGERYTRKEKDHIEWDAFFIFGPDAVWNEEGPSPLHEWGRTIVGQRDLLKEELRKLLQED